MSINYTKCPFPWFGGKQYAAPIIWTAIGDVEHYVEPFCGSLATLLLRPHVANRPYYSETVNDADGLLINFWRSVQQNPDAVADAASWPVAEADLHARHLRIVRWRAEQPLERLMADPDWCDPVIAGWWAWGQSSWIGSGWCSGTGAWSVNADGIFYKQERGTRQPGVARQLPHVSNNGQGVNHAGLREPGVSRQLPFVGNSGRGVNRPQLREPGVARQLPHLSDNGQGVNRPQLREPGVSDAERVYHPMTMPELKNWLQFLQARLRHVRILNGDWKRACTSGAAKTMPVRPGGHAGIFFDPPYGDVRCDGLYAQDSLTVAADVRRWCVENGDDPQYRIVLAGFTGEGHEELVSMGWREVEWFRDGFLRGGMANVSSDKAKRGKETQKQERLWVSPHCLPLEEPEEEPEEEPWAL